MASQRSLPLVIMETGEGRCGMIDTVRVGKTIQQLRKAKGMSQEVLSGLAGLDRTHYSKIERGLRSPNLDTLFKISKNLYSQPKMPAGQGIFSPDKANFRRNTLCIARKFNAGWRKKTRPDGV